MGAVFKARDRELETEVAIKVILQGLDTDPAEMLARFKREIQLSRRISHPNIARVFDFGVAGDIPYITMEFIPGRPFSALLREQKRVPADRLVAILRQVALGTHEAHKEGVAHRDLKPQNIMIDEAGAVAILDFGLAREIRSSSLTQHGQVMGTPYYMAPELARGDEPDPRCDIWAIGVIAFQALTGELPFEGTTATETFMASVSAPLPVEKLVALELPSDIVRIVKTCLEKNPADRYETAEDLATDLALVDLDYVLSSAVSPPASASAGEKAAQAKEPEAGPASFGDADTPVAPVRGQKASATVPTVIPRHVRRQMASQMLPQMAAPIAEPSPEASPPAVPEPSMPDLPRVLLVDDNRTYRRVMRVNLESSGCSVLEAQNGDEALHVLEENGVELVLMDVLMPKLDGFDTTRVLKSQSRYAKLPVILMSDFSERGRLAFAIQSGATDFIPKKHGMPACVEKVWRLLEMQGFRGPSPAGGAVAGVMVRGSETAPAGAPRAGAPRAGAPSAAETLGPGRRALPPTIPSEIEVQSVAPDSVSARKEGMRIAVIGTGISGLSAAWLLSRKHEVHVFEKEPRPGGHSNTIVAGGPTGSIPLDTGFLVFNQETYPLLCRLFEILGVESEESNMSFSVHCERCGLEYCGTGFSGLFAQKSNLVRPSFLKMLSEVLRFNREAPKLLEDPSGALMSLQTYLERGNYSSAFKNHYLIPMAAAVWSSGPDVMKSFPARMLVQFFKNHGFLGVTTQFRWRTVRGGSREYVKRMIEAFQDRLYLGSGPAGVRRERNGVDVHLPGGRRETFDKVVIATHADEALSLLLDPSAEEQRLLSPWRYSNNQTILHTDASFLPRAPEARASWNYFVRDCERPWKQVSLTYYLNKLQNVKESKPYLVTLNPDTPVDESTVIRRIQYTHPVFTRESVATQTELPTLNGIRNTYFCGAYFRYGFHEDGLKSGVDVAHALGVDFS